MTGDIAQMGQYIGAGLACFAMAGAGIGVGHVAGNFLNGALGILGLVVALLLIFAV